MSNRTLPPVGLVTYQVEEYDTCRAEIDACLRVHWLEIALDHDAVPLDKDEAGYRALANAGQLSIVTARRGGELVGYHASIVRPHLHYRSTLHAHVDVYWLRPDCRRGLVGYRLLQAAERALKARGVRKVFTGTKLHKDRGVLFERLGYRETERLYTKILGD